MVLRDLSGIGALQEALGTTNTLLAAVLAELRETNGARLERVAAELAQVNERLDQLLAQADPAG